MILLLILSFFGTSQVALSERSAAAYLNPAGLYFKPNVELKVGFYQDSSYLVSLSLMNMGFSVYGNNSSIQDYTVSSAAGYKNMAFGIFYGKNSRYGLGVMVRPTHFLSLGGVVDNKDNLQLGAAFSLLSNRLFLSVDYVKKDTLLTFGIGARPFKWMTVFTNLKKDGLSLGIDVYFGRMGISLKADTVRSGAEIMFSKVNYPSFIFKKHRWIKVVPRNYKEYRTKSGFLFPFFKKNSFYDFIYALNKVAEDPGIEGIYFDMRFSGLHSYQNEEILKVLKKAKSNGKKIVLFSDTYGISELPLMNIADRVVLVPEGEVLSLGFASTGMFFKGFLEKVGVKVEAPRIGKYKSAVEPFIRENYSEPAREQTEVLLSDYFEFLSDASSPKYDLSQMIDTGFFNSDMALKHGLVDTVLHVEKVKDYIKKTFGIKKMKMVSFSKYEREKPYDFSFGKKKENIALLVLDGDIIRGECSEGSLPVPVFGGRHIGSYTVIRILERLKNDKHIKGVVIRVNSPGGDALASEEIYSAVKSLAEKKPVVISMAGVAASGGYYISAPATYIMADNLTLTGSIGILNLKFVISDMLSKIGITTETVKIGEHADVFSPYRESTEEEKAFMQRELEWGYNMFLSRVSGGRGLTKDSVNTIGQGRVWSGTRGKEIGLVDEIGGVLDAVKKCAELAKVKEPVVRYVPCMKAKWLSFFGSTKEILRIPPSGLYYISPIIDVK